MSNPTALFEVRPSAVHGLGLYATCALAADSRLGTYEGRRLSLAEVEAEDWDSHLTYLFGLSDGTTIDGAQGGNELRHLNHSCQPNCEAVERLGDDGLLQLDIVALRAIAEGEELFIDYAFALDESDSADLYPCACLTAACRGTMASVD
jgi:SET domain-containing protein